MDNSDFDIQKEIEAYAAHITYGIQPIKRRESIKNEYIAHLEDASFRYMIGGMDEKTAFEKACNELGDVQKIQRMLTIAHRKDKISSFLLPIVYGFSLVIILLPAFVSNVKMDYATNQWIKLISLITSIVFSCSVFKRSYKYVRAYFKRRSLIKRVKKICVDKGYHLTYNFKYYTSIFGKSAVPEIIIVSDEKICKIKMFACLKKRDIYTLTSANSFFTTNNGKPIFLSYHYPTMAITKSRDYKLYLSPFYKSDNSYLKDVEITPEIDIEEGENILNILCLNPIAAKMEVVRTNRAEEVFDGDEFKGYIVYSGNGLCDFLKTL